MLGYLGTWNDFKIWILPPSPHIFQESTNMERNWNRGFVLIAIKLFKRTFVSKAIMELEERLRLVSRGGIWICPFLVYGQLCGLCILKIVAFSFRSLSKFVGRIY